MRNSISYKNCLIRGESFQRGQNGSWVPRYSLTHQDIKNKWNGAPSHHVQLDTPFLNENDADEFALRDALRWIDNH